MRRLYDFNNACKISLLFSIKSDELEYSNWTTNFIFWCSVVLLRVSHSQFSIEFNTFAYISKIEKELE